MQWGCLGHASCLRRVIGRVRARRRDTCSIGSLGREGVGYGEFENMVVAEYGCFLRIWLGKAGLDEFKKDVITYDGHD